MPLEGALARGPVSSVSEDFAERLLRCSVETSSSQTLADSERRLARLVQPGGSCGLPGGSSDTELSDSRAAV